MVNICDDIIMNALLCRLRNNSFKNFHQENLKCNEMQIRSQSSFLVHGIYKFCEGKAGLTDTTFREPRRGLCVQLDHRYLCKRCFAVSDSTELERRSLTHGLSSFVVLISK